MRKVIFTIPISLCLPFLALVAFVMAIPVYAACNVVNGKAYGDCKGVAVNSGIKGHLNVASVINEPGIMEGATIMRGGSLYLAGIANGNIVVLEGGHLTVTGIVNGSIINRGGNVDIEGTAGWVQNEAGKASISGIVSGVSGGGSFVYRRGAVVGGAPK